MSVRIVGGSMRGRRVGVPSSRGVRPTTDRVRESLFNMLANLCDLEGAVVADLFAGSGILGIEALSRGAEFVTFVEQNRNVAELLRQSLGKLGLSDRTVVVQQDVARYLASRDGASLYDVIFADPPYDSPLTDDTFREVQRLLRPGGRFILECSAATSGLQVAADTLGNRLQLVKRRTFGDTVVLIAVNADGAAESPFQEE